MKKYCVYKHSVPNGKVYIGITSMKPEHRWNNGFGYIDNNYFWYDIVQFGWQNIQHEILFDDLEQEDAERLEIEQIKKYKSTDFENGYNISSGGVCNYKISDASRLRRSISRLGAKNPNSKPVRCVETGEVFESSGEASRHKKINQSHISAVCRGIRKTAGKLHWEYY